MYLQSLFIRDLDTVKRVTVTDKVVFIIFEDGIFASVFFTEEGSILTNEKQETTMLTRSMTLKLLKMVFYKTIDVINVWEKQYV